MGDLDASIFKPYKLTALFVKVTANFLPRTMILFFSDHTNEERGRNSPVCPPLEERGTELVC